MKFAGLALVGASLLVAARCQSPTGLQWTSSPEGSMSGMNALLSTFLNSSMASSAMNNLAANLAGVSRSILTTPFIGLTSDPLKAVKSVVDDASQAVSSAAVQAADKVAVSQIKAADQVVHNATVQLANALPENDSELSLPGTQVQELKLGNETSGWAGFELPTIDLGDGISINPAAVNLDTLQQLASDISSQFCSPTFTNSSGTIPATLTYPTFTLTLETGACALTSDFSPNPDSPYDDWLATKGFVCETPQLSFQQEPTTYVAQYTGPATLITSSCKIAQNATDGWTKTLYSAGDPITYASWEAFMDATSNGTAISVFSPSEAQTVLAQIAADVQNYIAQAAAEAPPLVIQVESEKELLKQKLGLGRRLKEFLQQLD